MYYTIIQQDTINTVLFSHETLHELEAALCISWLHYKWRMAEAAQASRGVNFSCMHYVYIRKIVYCSRDIPSIIARIYFCAGTRWWRHNVWVDHVNLLLAS